MDLEVARNFVIALLIGALVGIDRERKKTASPGGSFGGIRTHILIALLGAASAQLALQQSMPWLLVVALAVVGAAVVASYVHGSREHDDAHGLTSELAAMAVFVLAAMAVAGEAALAVALGVALSATLAFKQPLHGAVARLDTADVFVVLKLLIASFIVLPLLPDQPIDPWQVINPYKLWLLVILISALSLAGYVAVRWLGSSHGLALTGLAGGLVSSTATTLSFARSSRDAGGLVAADAHANAHANELAAGILLAWLVMFARVAVLIALLNRALLAQAGPALAAMASATAAFALWNYRTGLASAGREGPTAVAVSNPFSLAAASRFAILFAAVLLIVEAAKRYAPAQGAYLVAALAGSVDVDAITLSMADSARPTQEHSQAAAAIVVAVLSNTVVKCGVVLTLGAGRVRWLIVAATAVLLTAGLLVLTLDN